MNFFKLYIGDYQRDTAHLSVTEHGAYLLMLQHYYATERPLPIGKALHRMLRAQDKAERDAIDAVVAQFWSETDEGLVNGRADVEITKAGAQAAVNASIAREREAKRKAARGDNERSTNRATNDQPNQTPDTRHQTNNPQTPKGADDPQGFAEFWDAWPKSARKGGRAECLKVWKRNGLESVKTEILAHVRHMAGSSEWSEQGGKFIPAPVVYLRGAKWDGAELGASSGGLQLFGGV